MADSRAGDAKARLKLFKIILNNENILKLLVTL
jgi:hypothetical protein